MIFRSPSVDEVLQAEFDSLEPDVLYNVTITPINKHGAGPVISQAFWTPGGGDDVVVAPPHSGDRAGTFPSY